MADTKTAGTKKPGQAGLSGVFTAVWKTHGNCTFGKGVVHMNPQEAHEHWACGLSRRECAPECAPKLRKLSSFAEGAAN